jgi:hypothetical protein
LRALVTGASSGIGKVFAEELAKRGYDLVLVARRKERLEKLAHDLSSIYGVAVEPFVADLTDFDKLRELVERFSDIDLLINNAGFGLISPFVEIDTEKGLKMVDLNIRALYYLTKEFSKKMVKRNGNEAGIINIASTAAFQPVPGFATYAATKAFVLSLTEAFSKELEGRVKIMVVCPGPTKTEFFNVAGLPNMRAKFIMTPEKVVKGSLRAFEKGKRTYIPGFFNKLLVFLQRFVSRELALNVVARFFYEKPEGEV